MSRAADTEAAVREASEGQEVNEQESDADSEHFEDASDGAATHHDFDINMVYKSHGKHR